MKSVSPLVATALRKAPEGAAANVGQLENTQVRKQSTATLLDRWGSAMPPAALDWTREQLSGIAPIERTKRWLSEQH